MALFGSHWNENDRLSEKRGMRAKLDSLFEDIWEDSKKEIEEEVHAYFETEKYKKNSQFITSKIQELTLNELRPKMHWVQKSTPYAPAARFYCSNCGNDEMYKTPFCPICGAMEVKDD